jgi:DNA polymerase III alpha subunit
MRLRTGYSFRVAAGELTDAISRIQEIGWPVAPITDRASTFGWVRWEKLVKGAGLRPVFGIELAVVANLGEKKPTTDNWLFFGIDSVAPLNRLIELATEQFYYQPLITYDQAMKAEGVIRVCGHRAVFDAFKPDENTYYGLSPASTKGHVRRAQEHGLQLVATSDNYFPRREDIGFYEVVCGRGASTQTYDQHLQSEEEWLQGCRRAVPVEGTRRDALALRDTLWARCNAQLQSAELIHPPHDKDLREMCLDGAAKLGCNLDDPVYAERLDRELRLIAEKKFEDYFYLVADICQFARKRMAVGPARGSSCGSLVCYLLEITTVDPIPHGLIFERFIDVNRADLPDIDIDFSDQNRHLVFEHLGQKYGRERVARLGTVAMFKARSALQEAGAALKVPKWKCDAVVEALIERSSGDSRVNDTLEDTLKGTPAGREVLEGWPEILIAAKMEGHPRHYSQHAAGVVVASEPLVNYVAVDHRTNAVMCDKYDAEGRLGLLKIDALGLTQLSVFEDTLEMVGLTMEDLQRAPLDDQSAFDVLNRGEFSGIFQWNGNALQSLTRQIKVDRFDDIVAISALARPGPLATGGATQWAKRRMGGAIGDAIHPLLAELTKDTYQVVIYQETVMMICREIGNFSWAETAEIRKLMSRRMGNERFQAFEAKFVQGAGENGMPEEAAKEIWDQINTFGSWAFNKSHAVAYGYISYWCCWLKAHFPFEFAAATLTHETEESRQIQLLREMRDEGYDYIPVDKDISIDKWTVGYKENSRFLVGPLGNVTGIGPKLTQQILHARANGAPLPAKAQKLLENPVTKIDSLTPIGDAFARLLPDPSERNITSRPTPICKLHPSNEPYEVMLFCTPIKINPRDENEAINVQKRGFEIKDGMTDFLQLRLADDTGMVMGKINRFNFERLGPNVINTGRAGKALWAFKGKVYTVGDGFLVFSINKAKYIGDMEKDNNQTGVNSADSQPQLIEGEIK